MELLTDPAAWTAFLTLTLLELVLGIDNIVFITILTDRLPPEQRQFGRRLGLGLAMFMRIALLLALAWLVGLTTPLFELFGQGISGRDLILIGGGLFLLWKSTTEMHHLMTGFEEQSEARPAASFGQVLIQICIVDMVFSLDSIITAVGLGGPDSGDGRGGGCVGGVDDGVRRAHR